MKRLVLIFAVFALIAAASCSKEQDELSTAYNSDVKAMMAVLENSGVDLKNVTVNEKMKCFIVEGDVVSFSSITDIQTCLSKMNGSVIASDFGVRIRGPLLAEANEDCTYTAVITPNNSIPPYTYTWAEHDENGVVLVTGEGPSYSTTMPWEKNLFISLTVNSSDGKTATAEFCTITRNPVIEH